MKYFLVWNSRRLLQHVSDAIWHSCDIRVWHSRVYSSTRFYCAAKYYRHIYVKKYGDIFSFYIWVLYRSFSIPSNLHLSLPIIFHSVVTAAISRHSQIEFRFLLNQSKSNCIYRFQIDFEPNWIPFGSQSNGNLSLRSLSIKFERNKKSFSLKFLPL